jgi:hypothetical protein
MVNLSYSYTFNFQKLKNSLQSSLPNTIFRSETKREREREEEREKEEEIYFLPPETHLSLSPSLPFLGKLSRSIKPKGNCCRGFGLSVIDHSPGLTRSCCFANTISALKILNLFFFGGFVAKKEVWL